MSEFYNEVSINRPVFHYEFNTIDYWENKLKLIEETITQINVELQDCIKKMDKYKTNVFIRNEAQFDATQYKTVLNINYEIDDSLMEITDDLIINNILNENKKIYSINTIDFLNRLFKLLTKDEFNSKPFTNYKESLLNIKTYINDKKLSVEALFFNYKDLVISYTPSEYDFKYLSLLDRQNIMAQGEEISSLIMYYNAIIVECYNNKLNTKSDLKEIKEDIEYLNDLNLEKQEELRRCIMILKELRDDETKEIDIREEDNKEN